MTPREEELNEQITVLENDLSDARERIKQLEEDLRLRDAELLKLKAALGQWCEIEKRCAEILGTDYVKGDSYSVPGALACVEEVVKRFKCSQRDLKQLEEDLERSRVTNERLIQKLETEVKSVAVLEEDVRFSNEQVKSLVEALQKAKNAIQREDVRFWKGEAETGISTVNLRETEITKLQRDLADMTQLAADYKRRKKSV